jgi:serine phosphatase RsbU (regulator of sigma subunit)
LECIDDDFKRLNLDKHLTMLYGQLDHREHVLCLSNGGHYPYPVLCTPQDSLTLEIPGCALGLLPDATFQNETMKCPESARLLLLSDGVLELLSQDSLREKNAELHRVAAQPELDADMLVDAFGIDDGARLRDDVAILLIQREGS